ncbi:uncharacterized protein LOC144660299 [Oculina patagonica]
MSRYPHRAFAERNKRVQMQNCIEDKFLKQKLDAFSRERLYIDRELRRISLAKESLMESLDRYTAPPSLANKRLSLPCLIEGSRNGTNTSSISAPRRHTVDSAQDLHTVAEHKRKLKPLSFVQGPTPRLKEGIPVAEHKPLSSQDPTTSVTEGTSVAEHKHKVKPLSSQDPTLDITERTPKKSPCGERKSHLQRPRSAFRATSLENQQDVPVIRVTSPVTASLIQSGQNRFTNERPALNSRRSNIDETLLHLPKLPASPAKREVNPLIPRNIYAGHASPRDGMLATNLKSKFRQIGSVVMATAILRAAHEKKKTTGKERDK